MSEIIAKAVKLADGSDEVENATELAEDFVKIIPGGISSIFQLVVLSARLASMYAEAGRGRGELPLFLVKVGELLQCVTE